ncbi:MAG: ankyrin repeat domain-containing protein [Rhizobiaceae bacterium]
MRFILSAIGLFLISIHGVLAGPLGDAAKSGDKALVEKLLDDGADIDEMHAVGTALHWAALNGHADVAAVLATRGANLDAKSDLLGSPLHAAANRDHADVVLVLLEGGAGVDIRDKNNKTPLHIAAKTGSVKVAVILIDKGADVNAVTVGHAGNRYKLGEQTPLHIALQGGHSEIVDVLKSAGSVAMPVQPSSEILAKADIQKGKELAVTYCKTCHAIEAGDPEPAALDRGPPIIGIIGQEVARDASFEYSESLKEFGREWTDDRIYSFVLRPMLTVPGTIMGHQLVKKPDEIANIIAYMKSLDQ